VDRALILRVMVPMGALSVLLLVVAVIVVLAGGKSTGEFTLTTEPKPEVPPPAAGDVPYQGMDTTMRFDKFPLDDPGWKFLDEANFPGLKYLDSKEGGGETVMHGKSVDVFYTGWRLDGVKFDSSDKGGGHGKVSFSLNGVIQGWKYGIPGMKVGGTRRLYIPSQFAYGQRGNLPTIRPNDDLVFEIQILGTH
jgi:FKBP-type peptidyl-prolyl cis-trans isomerase FkpA